ncbi:MAG: glycosyltransferase family 39 protein [Bradymonadaceae bacterium]|nr:glycosyltransferase family 39 protein [Lujinxingiaceae bacterium]
MNQPFGDKRIIWVLLAIVLLGMGLRSYQLTDPDIKDFHAWRQADTAAFAQGYLVENLNPFLPSIARYPCDLRAEPFGRVEAELPVVSWFAALPLAAIGMQSVPPWYLRLISIGFFGATCLYLFLMVLKLGGRESEALLSVVAFSLLPLSVFFTRTIQPDGPALFFSTAFLYHLLTWLKDDRLQHGVLSALFGAVVFLLKISNAFLFFPAIYLFVTRKGLWQSIKTPRHWAWGFAIIVPVIAWYMYARGFAWSFGVWGDRGSSKFTNWELFTSATIWRTLASRAAIDIFTVPGLALMVVGLTQFRERELVRFATMWTGAVLLFIVAVLGGNNTHVYYQLPIVLPASLLIGVAVVRVWNQQIAGKLVLALAFVIYAVTANHVLFAPKDNKMQNGYFQVDVPASILEGSALVSRHLVGQEKFVAHTNNPTLYSNSGHRGWFQRGQNVNKIVACAGPDAPYLLLNNAVTKRLESSIARDAKLRARLKEVERGKHMSLWKVEDF